MTCAKCTLPITPAASGVKYRSKTYHPACLESMKAAAKQKDAKTSAQLNDPDLQRLTSYLCECFSIPALTPMLSKQVADLRTQRGYSYASILLAARYFFEMGQGALQQDDDTRQPTLGIIPYIYDEAMRYWRTVDEANEVNQARTLQNRTVIVPFSPKSRFLDCSCNIEDL